MAYAADEHILSPSGMGPHSNAKKGLAALAGPLSRLSQSGALVDTVQKGAEKRSMTLEKALPALGPSDRASVGDAAQALGADDANSSSYTIHIQNLTVQASDIKNALEFVRMLQDAGAASTAAPARGAGGAYAALQ